MLRPCRNVHPFEIAPLIQRRGPEALCGALPGAFSGPTSSWMEGARNIVKMSRMPIIMRAWTFLGPEMNNKTMYSRAVPAVKKPCPSVDVNGKTDMEMHMAITDTAAVETTA